MDDGRAGSQNVSANPDWDYERNSNLFFYPYADQVYYYPQYSTLAVTGHDSPDVFLVGKSFLHDVQFYLAKGGISNRVYFCKSGVSYMDSNFSETMWANRDIEAMRQDFAASEIIVLEYNAYNEGYYFYDSIASLLELLETTASSEFNFPASFNACYSSADYTRVVRGFFNVNQILSEPFYWMSKNGSVNLSSNGEFEPNTVILDCSIPADYIAQHWQTDVSGYEYSVYINGQEVGSFPVGTERRETFYFDVRNLPAPDGTYCVEIFSPLTFQGKNTNEKYNDDRELSLRVYSCYLSSRTLEELREGEG